jgi:tetratricopeptide (TPR) repeat protein
METRLSHFLSVIPLLLLCAATHAQEHRLVRKGNELYMQQKYAAAAKAYQEALQRQSTFTPGVFNLGNALIQQKQYDAARKVMANAAKTSKDPLVQSGANYNAGNTFMSEQQWQQAVDAYKQALHKNPQDADAKYNLSYALAKLKQQQGGGNGKDNQKNNQQNKDNKNNQDKQKNDKNKQQQQKQDQNDQQQQQQQRPQPQQSKISEQQADNLLKALQQDERKVQDKMQQGKATPVRMEKDW